MKGRGEDPLQTKMNENPTYGSGQYSHEVPAEVGVVVEIRDGQHKGTAVWRREHRDTPFVFASYDDCHVGFAERCVLVRGQDLDTLEYDHCCGCDLESPDGLLLRGIDRNDDLSWLSKGAEVLWDSEWYWAVCPAGTRDPYPAGYDGNRFASEAEAEAAIPGLRAVGEEYDHEWTVVRFGGNR